MKLKVNLIINTHETGYKDKVYKSWWVEGDTIEDCFIKTYPSERSNRYCYGYRIKFDDSDIDDKWQEWKHSNVTPKLYYGDATVD